MNREIKFRFWVKTNEFMINNDDITGFEINYQYNILNVIGNDNYEKELSDVAIMQYTGLKDKNGKEIYEGDILFSEIYFNGTNKLVKIIDGMKCEPFEYYMSTDDFEIIGNIYENPELLRRIGNEN